ncbi:hypothetical protein NLG97_g1513 [Lecanicillium saksenae]|uniref:Uncharacterized protein n=1 Tax=Lecanicillium saksenae TaxID=468837 RepID=A0ACC1R3J2_9HYPO|nr:hypothetical protein NLG97_g1513 [Lecanicillium saksenae]
MSRSDRAENIAVAQAWMDTLSQSKRHVLSLMFRRRDIMDALDSMLPFPGVWDGLQLGNWAKHLAAHLDQAIISYWKHIKTVWETIMAGKQHLYHLLTADDVARLQYRAPAQSIADRKYIEEAFSKFELFKGIADSEVRASMLANTLSIGCVIPSIQTFHQNMRYITIGAKVLERTIQVQEKSKRRNDCIGGNVPCLFQNLRKDWRPTNRNIEIAPSEFVELPGTSDAYLAFLVLFFRGSEKFPLSID